ncbi:hypothetical protein [Mesorhizobium sp. M0698]|uniref:hypothetical protein n=1 Tax=Mesorhizobium sp. M0698 TaxID=2956987 RepID=UPI0033367EA6
MAANRKISRGTIRRPRRGLKPVRKSTPAKARDETKNDSASKAGSKKPKKINRGKSAGPAAKTNFRPIKSKVADLLRAEKPLNSEALDAAAAKPAGASPSATPVNADVAIEPRDALTRKPPIPEPRAGGKAPATVPASRPQRQGKAEIALKAETEAAAPALLSRPRDIKRYADLAGPDMVPLSRKVSQVIWAFELVDAITETSVVGKTRIFAVLKGKEEDIELTTFSSRSGRLVLQTRTTLENDVSVTSLAPVAGGMLSQDDVVELRFENDLYDPIAIAKKKFFVPVVLSPAPSYPFPSAHDPNGRMAFILGRAPAAFDAGGIAKMIDSPMEGAVGRESLVDRQRRFALWGPAEKISDDKPNFEVKLEISDAPSGSRKLTLIYRATREKSDDNSGTKADANNTDRMKLTGLSLTPADAPPIQAKDVPPVHLLLQ